MYYPYLRGHTSELSALREMAGKIALSGNITPIIEPVNLNSETINSLREFQRANMPFILIVNPSAGGRSPEISKINELVYGKLLKNYNCYQMGMIINRRASLKEIELFVENFAQVPLALIHFENFSDPAKLAALIAKSPMITTQAFIEGKITKQYLLQVDMRTKTVLIRDCLNKLYDYLHHPEEELFSDMHSLYIRSGFDGFGDFTVWGDINLKEGIRNSHLIIHFPYFRRKENQIWVKHFAENIAVKGADKKKLLSKIMEEIVSFLTKNPAQIRTEGAKEIIETHKRGSIIDFSRLKSVIIMHHLELVSIVL